MKDLEFRYKCDKCDLDYQASTTSWGEQYVARHKKTHTMIGSTVRWMDWESVARGITVLVVLMTVVIMADVLLTSINMSIASYLCMAVTLGFSLVLTLMLIKSFMSRLG